MFLLVIAFGVLLGLLALGAWNVSRIWTVPGVSVRQRWAATSPPFFGLLIFLSMACVFILHPSNQRIDAYFPVIFISWGVCAILASLILFFFAKDLESVVLAMKKHKPLPASLRWFEGKASDPRKLVRIYRIAAVVILLVGFRLIYQNLGPSTVNESWVRIDKQTFWHNDSYFVDDTYNFPDIAFEHPPEWTFNCCGDMDHASEHLLCSNETCDKTFVKITDYALAGCPSGKQDCSIDQQVSKTATQKYNELAAGVQADANNQIFPVVRVPGLDTDALVYAKNNQSRSYLINLGDDVIDVEFPSTQETDDDFIMQFLSRLDWDRK